MQLNLYTVHTNFLQNALPIVRYHVAILDSANSTPQIASFMIGLLLFVQYIFKPFIQLHVVSCFALDKYYDVPMLVLNYCEL